MEHSWRSEIETCHLIYVEPFATLLAEFSWLETRKYGGHG